MINFSNLLEDVDSLESTLLKQWNKEFTLCSMSEIVKVFKRQSN